MGYDGTYIGSYDGSYDGAYGGNYDGRYFGSYHGRYDGSYDGSYGGSYDGTFDGTYDDSTFDWVDGSYGWNLKVTALETRTYTALVATIYIIGRAMMCAIVQAKRAIVNCTECFVVASRPMSNFPHRV